MGMPWAPEFENGVLGLTAAVGIAVLAVVWRLRERRNSVLEEIVAQSAPGLLDKFRGTLSVARYEPREYLQLATAAPESRRLQIYYRWIVGKGREAVFDEVTFDAPRKTVLIKRGDRCSEKNFVEFAGIGLREVATSRGNSRWHIELIPRKGRAVPFVSSVSGSRSLEFEFSASLAKAVSDITELPVQVRLAGNIWTSGWPPKTAVVSQSRNPIG
jgi:hypothetical protein